MLGLVVRSFVWVDISYKCKKVEYICFFFCNMHSRIKSCEDQANIITTSCLLVAWAGWCMGAKGVEEAPSMSEVTRVISWTQRWKQAAL